MTALPCHNDCGRPKQHGRGYRYCAQCGPAVRLSVKKACDLAWRQEHESPEYTLRKRLATRYNLTLEAFQAILARQSGGCAICRTGTPGGSGTWHVDHDHACCPGRRSCGLCVRGLLCASCNRYLVPVVEGPWIFAALRYLEAARARS